VLQVVSPEPASLEIVVVPFRVALLNSFIVAVAVTPFMLVVIRFVLVEKDIDEPVMILLVDVMPFMLVVRVLPVVV
jgi:hypothetical protein